MAALTASATALAALIAILFVVGLANAVDATTVPQKPKSVAVGIVDEHSVQVFIEPPLDDGGSDIIDYNFTVSSEKTWFRVLKYSDTWYTPTTDAVGDIHALPSAGFSKLADAAINAEISDAAEGNNYYKLSDSTTDVMFVRTQSSYTDTARGFGWPTSGYALSLCGGVSTIQTLEQLKQCTWATNTGSCDIGSTCFDSFNVLTPNDCTRWFADYRHADTPNCLTQDSSNNNRCFNQGVCVTIAPMRKNVSVEKFALPPTSNPFVIAVDSTVLQQSLTLAVNSSAFKDSYATPAVDRIPVTISSVVRNSLGFSTTATTATTSPPCHPPHTYLKNNLCWACSLGSSSTTINATACFGSCGNVDGSNGDFASCIRGTNHLKTSPDSVTCAANTCVVNDCCDSNPTCNDIYGNGSNVVFASCVSGVNHLKSDLNVTCATGTCTTSDCCDANPSCIGFSGCVNGVNQLKSDLNVTCATGTCATSDCCDPVVATTPAATNTETTVSIGASGVLTTSTPTNTETTASANDDGMATTSTPTSTATTAVAMVSASATTSTPENTGVATTTAPVKQTMLEDAGVIILHSGLVLGIAVVAGAWGLA